MNLYVTVRIEVDDELKSKVEDPLDIVSECDYNFSFEEKELNTEIVEVEKR